MTATSARALLHRLGGFLDTFSTCFSRRPQPAAASQYIAALFNDSERKSMQAMHGRLSDPTSYQALQHFVTHSPWSAERVWAHLRTQVPTRTGILALDDTGFPKQGTQSVGVQRQYCGALGKIGNCQVAVSTALIADARTWPLTFELYLPDAWMRDPDRREAVGIPATARFREKWRIGLAHVRTVLKAGFTLTGVVVDADYGSNGRFREGLERLGVRYAAAIRGGLTFWTAGARRTATAAVIAAAAFPDDWHAVTWGTGTKQPLTADFYAVRVRAPKGRGDRWLLCERSGDERKYYLLNLAPTATLGDLVTLARSRWPIEQQYRELKDDLGLDHFEGRTYRGWTHHVVLTAVAFTFLQLERARRRAATVRPTLPIVRGWLREIFGLLYVANSRRLLNMVASFQRNPPLRT